jgi:hypothetical protein
VEDVYTLKIMNKTEREQTYVVSVSGPGVLQLDPSPPQFTVPAGNVYPASVRVRRAAYEPEGNETIRFRIQSTSDPRLTVSHEARFLAPGGGHHEHEQHDERH